MAKKAEKKSKQTLAKENKSRKIKEKKTPAATTKARGKKQTKGGYTKARRSKAAKLAWKTRRSRYGEKGWTNKPGPKGPRKAKAKTYKNPGTPTGKKAATAKSRMIRSRGKK